MNKLKLNIKLKPSWLLNSIIAIAVLIIIIMLGSMLIRFFVIKHVDSTLSSNVVHTIPNEGIQVSVLNSTQVSGLADKARNYLRARGFDVVQIGNFKSKVNKSFILDRLNDIESSKKVANACGISDSLITTAIDSSLFIRTTIIIGNDYYNLKLYK